MVSKIEEYSVFKVGDMYLCEVWEEWEEDINYSFTCDLYDAMAFHKWSNAPKYLWDSNKETAVKTIEEMCEMFGGKMVKVRQTRSWKEIDEFTSFPSYK